MEKHAGKFNRCLILALLAVIIGFYSFTQALQAPLSKTAAEKVLAAWNILQHTEPPSSWTFHPLELPIYLFFVRILGLGTFASIAVCVFFYWVLFCIGLFVLKARGLINMPNLLIVIALTGLPDPNWICAIQNAPFLIFGLILTPHFLFDCFDHHKKVPAILSLLCFLLTVSAFPKPLFHMVQPYAVHETLRALQSIFRADFSRQPIMNFTTGRYFLMTIVLLLMIWSIIRTVRQFHTEGHRLTEQLLYALFIFMTLFWCCLPFSGDREQKTILCSWLPFGTALLLIFIKESPTFRDLRLCQRQLSLSSLVCIFSLFTILFNIGPIARSRPVSPADRVIIYLNEQKQLQGYCEQSDFALLSVAAKGNITFSTERDTPGNTFTILHTSLETDKAAKIEEIPPYLVLINQ